MMLQKKILDMQCLLFEIDYKTAFFSPSTPGTLDFPVFLQKNSFQIQLFEGRVLKSFFSSTFDALDCQIVIVFPSFAVFKGCAEAIFQIEDIHVFFLHQDNSTKN